MSRTIAAGLAGLFFAALHATALPTPQLDSGLFSYIEPNTGQLPAAYTHLVRTSDYNALLRANEALFVTTTKAADSADQRAVRMRLRGANEDAHVAADVRLPGHSNYLLGDKPHAWVTGVEHYRRVTFDDVYPGIDLVYTLNDGLVRYDFVVAPGADTDVIRLEFVDADGVTLEAGGRLKVKTDHLELTHSTPRIYQEHDGEQREIAGGFDVHENGTLRFRVAGHDEARALVIDPQITLSTFLGGTDYDQGLAITVDGAGRTYIAGRTQSLDFPTVTPLQAGNAGNNDTFVARLAADGQSLEYVTYLGGSADDEVHQVSVDSAGNVVLAGYTASADYPTVNAVQSVFAGGIDQLFIIDGFVTKLNAAGDELVYSTYLGGGDVPPGLFGVGEWVRGLTLDDAGNAYVVGETSSSDFPATQELNGRGCLEGEAGLNSIFIGDAFVGKIRPDGTLEFLVCIGDADRDTGRGIALAPDGAIHIVGFTRSDAYPVSSGAYQATRAGIGGAYDTHVTRLNATATAIEWATFVGGSSFDYVQQVRLAPDGSSVVIGTSFSSDFPTTPGAFQTISGSPDVADDAVLFRVAPDGASLIFASYFGGELAESGWALDLDAIGRIYVAGTTDSRSFPLAAPTQPVIGSIANVDSDIGPDTDSTLSLAAGRVIRNGIDADVLVAGNDGVNRLYEFDGGGRLVASVDIGTETNTTSAIALYDGNFDGFREALIAANDGAPVQVYLNDGNGDFPGPPTDLAAPLAAARALVIGEIDGAAEQDLIVGNFLGSNALYLDGPGFGAATFPFPGSELTATSSLALADINGDGALDLVEGNDGGANLVYLRSGAGFLAGAAIGSEIDGTVSILALDIDGDLDNDIVVGNYGEPNRLYRNLGGGVFGPAEDLDQFAVLTNDIVVANFDSDGDLDLLADDGTGGWAYRNDGSGNFTLESLPEYPEPATVFVSGNRLWRGTAAGTPIRRASLGFNDAYVAAFDAGGSRLLFSTYVGGSGSDRIEWGLDHDDGSVYVTGVASDADFPTAATLQPFAGRGDAFVTRFQFERSRSDVSMFEGHGYELVEEGLTWPEADDYASQQYFAGVAGHLAVITSMGEDEFIVNEFNVGADPFFGPWIGLYCRDGEDCTDKASYAWTTGEASAYDGFNAGEPSGDCAVGIGRDCGVGYIDLGAGGWNDFSQASTLDLVIEYPVATEPVIFRGHAYQLFNRNDLTFEEAAAFAGLQSYQGVTGHLAVIRSPAEDAFIKNEYGDAASPVGGPWIGLYCRNGEACANPASYAWVTGDPVDYNGFAPAEPNSDCAVGISRICGVGLIGSPVAGWNDQDPLGFTQLIVEYPLSIDTDGDSIDDDEDNCIGVANPGQEDTNGDAIGNACDADIAPVGAEDCLVNFLDLSRMRVVFFTADPDADLVGPGAGPPDGIVNFLDLQIVRDLFFGQPGPSAFGCN